MSQQAGLSVSPDSPLWVQRVAHTVNSAAEANGLRLAFRQVDTDDGPVLSILLGPPKPLDVVTIEVDE